MWIESPVHVGFMCDRPPLRLSAPGNAIVVGSLLLLWCTAVMYCRDVLPCCQDIINYHPSPGRWTVLIKCCVYFCLFLPIIRSQRNHYFWHDCLFHNDKCGIFQFLQEGLHKQVGAGDDMLYYIRKSPSKSTKSWSHNYIKDYESHIRSLNGLFHQLSFLLHLCNRHTFSLICNT